MLRVIGLTGTLGSGKGSISNLLQKQGYKQYVFSDILKAELKKQRKEITRENLQDIGNKLRKTHGLHVLSQKIKGKILKDKVEFAIIDGIRNPGELTYARENFDNVIIIGITASPETRFERIIKRKRSSDPNTLKEFKRLETRDRGVGEERYGQQVQKCLDMADFLIINEGVLINLEKRVEEILNEFV